MSKLGALPAAGRLLSGGALALAAGLMWGLVFVVAPLLLPEYPALLQSAGRYLAFGLIALPLAWLDRRRLARLTGADWLEAASLGAVGNLLYYAFLASAIQRAGAQLPAMVIGTLPVVIAICSNLRGADPGGPQAASGQAGGAGGVVHDGRLPWRRLLPSLALIGAGIALVNHAEWTRLQADAASRQAAPASGLVLGALLAVGAVACWTWYPLRNADWLRAHAGCNSGTWATAQGVATLPLALLAYAGFWAAWALGGSAAGGAGVAAMTDGTAGGAAQAGRARFELLAAGALLPFGPRPLAFVITMAALGLFASWLGTLCWNGASQRLPTPLLGQLIVFETLAALAYTFALDFAQHGRLPPPQTLAGVALLVAGVLWALRVGPKPAVSNPASA